MEKLQKPWLTRLSPSQLRKINKTQFGRFNKITLVAFIFAIIPHLALLFVCGLAYEIEVPVYHNLIFIFCIFAYMVRQYTKNELTELTLFIPYIKKILN